MLSIQRQFDRKIMQSLERDLTAKIKSNRGKASASGSTRSTVSANLKYELKFNTYRSSFRPKNPGTRWEYLKMRIVRPLAPGVPIAFELKNISLTDPRSTSELKTACHIPPTSSPEDADVDLDFSVEKMTVSVDDNGQKVKAQTRLDGGGNRTSSFETTPPPNTVAGAPNSVPGSKPSAPMSSSAPSSVDDPGGLFSQPAQLPTTKPSTPAYRTWTDTSGKFRIEAQLVKFDTSTVELKKQDGKTVQVPFSKLSEADQRYLRSLK